MSNHASPFPGQMFAKADFASYEDERSLTDVMDGANVVTSVVTGWSGLVHKPVIDIDLPVTLVPSSTPGHFHLFIDKSMTWEEYAALLDALVAAGIVEANYVQASLARRHTAVRLPWVRKGQSDTA